MQKLSFRASTRSSLHLGPRYNVLPRAIHHQFDALFGRFQVPLAMDESKQAFYRNAAVLRDVNDNALLSQSDSDSADEDQNGARKRKRPMNVTYALPIYS